MQWKALLPATLFVTAAALGSSAVHAAEVKVIAANAVRTGLTELISNFEKSSGHKVVVAWAGTTDATRRVSEGEVHDLVIVGSANIDQLTTAGRLAAGSRADFAKSGVGMAVRGGLPKPDVSSSDALKATLLAANSIAYSAGPSGAYVAEFLKRLGIGEQVAAKVKQPANGAEVAAMLGRGEVDFEFAQVSEFLDAKGITDLGPLPASIQNYTIYAVGLHSAAPAAEAARALVSYLQSPEAASAIKKMGMDPG